MAQGPVAFAPAPSAAGAGGRLSAALQQATKRAGDRLQPKLEQANQRRYQQAMAAHAKQFGTRAPKTITDADVLAGITRRAALSAQSIAQTQAGRMRALVAQYGSRAAAQGTFDAWAKAQNARIAAYETSMAAHQAQDDFVERNQLRGTERCMPADTAGLDDSCDDAVAMGEVPIGDLPDLPAHVNCPHWAVQTYDPVADPTSLWFGA